MGNIREKWRGMGNAGRHITICACKTVCKFVMHVHVCAVWGITAHHLVPLKRWEGFHTSLQAEIYTSHSCT